MMATDIITYLTSKAVGGTLFDSFDDLAGSPSGIRTVITVYGGSSPFMVQEDADKRIDVVRFQAMTEGSDPQATEIEAHRVQRELARIRNQTINSIFYLSVVPLQSPFFVNWSEPVSGLRYITYASNYEVMKQPYLL